MTEQDRTDLTLGGCGPQPLASYLVALGVLGLPALPAGTLPDWLAAAVRAWAGMMPTLATLR